ncbi:MAG: hypothetical protein ISQ86_03285, partial [Alphaproteobacteria bacterium]|nr:hypothetical protein [Alphaproteobacteria bacterium]
NIRALDATLAWQVLEGFAPQTYNVANDDDPRHGFVVNRAHNKLHHHKLHAMGLYVEPDAKGHGGAMDYGKMTPFISAAVLDLRSHLDTHEQEISRLKERVAQLEAERKAA